MGLASIRRWSDDILLCNNILVDGFSGFEDRYAKPNIRSTSGVTQTQKVSSQETWVTMVLEFASDDALNTLARKRRMVYEANNDYFFRYRHIDGTNYKFKIMAAPTVARVPHPTVDIEHVTIVCKEAFHTPLEGEG